MPAPTASRPSARLALFSLGRSTITPAAQITLVIEQVVPLDLLRRHVQGDWGSVSPESAAANDAGLTEGGRLFSVYTLPSGEVVWVITEGDRSSTCILLPSDY
jgi:hypothetical protein